MRSNGDWCIRGRERDCEFAEGDRRSKRFKGFDSLRRSFGACLVIACSLGCTGCSTLSRWLTTQKDQQCISGSTCAVILSLQPLDLQHPDLCVLLIPPTVRVGRGTVVEWDLPQGDFGRVVRFKPPDPATGSGVGAGIDIDLGAPTATPDFITPTIDITGTKFYWTANPEYASNIERSYTINVVFRYSGKDVPCKLDPIIVNEG